MPSFKRNQIEEAISRFEEWSGRSASELVARVKRLLEADRNLGRSARSDDPVRANFAFYSDEARGTGVDVDFSDYEAFALLIGLRMLEFGFPQGTAVSVLRTLRLTLQKEHARILRQDVGRLFDFELIRKKARPGSLGVGTTDPVFLCIFGVSRSASEGRSKPISFSVCRGEEKLWEFVAEARKKGLLAWSTFELAEAAHILSDELSRTEPRKRGRGSR